LLPIVEADPRDLYERDPADPTGKGQKLRPISELPRHLARAISRLKIDPETGEPIDVIFASKIEAGATLLRSLPGGSVERHEVTSKIELFDPTNLAKLSDDEIEALKSIAAKIVADAHDAG
jgi:hypothetical protein